jgi:hypothetical protein
MGVLAALNRLDVVDAAAIPLRAESVATRCGEMVEQVGHRVARTMRGNEVVARKSGPPIALGARDEDRLALFVGKPVVRLLDGDLSISPGQGRALHLQTLTGQNSIGA